MNPPKAKAAITISQPINPQPLAAETALSLLSIETDTLLRYRTLIEKAESIDDINRRCRAYAAAYTLFLNSVKGRQVSPDLALPLRKIAELSILGLKETFTSAESIEDQLMVCRTILDLCNLTRRGAHAQRWFEKPKPTEATPTGATHDASPSDTAVDSALETLRATLEARVRRVRPST